MPGSDPRLCAKEYLDVDDFWDDDWGDMPPYLPDDYKEE